jgi:hypothetical protein
MLYQYRSVQTVLRIKAPILECICLLHFAFQIGKQEMLLRTHHHACAHHSGSMASVQQQQTSSRNVQDAARVLQAPMPCSPPCCCGHSLPEALLAADAPEINPRQDEATGDEVDV